MTFRYQWQSCDATGSACADIAGKTASKMQLKSSDVGRTVRVRVTADNSALPGGGRVSATSAASGLIQALPPMNTAVPTISGTLEDGAKLTATKGSWKGSTPRLYSYAWQRCDATGAACIDIPGATDRILVLGAADVGRTARVRVTADNSALPGGGTASARSAATAPIVSVITGVAQQGHALAASGGSFTYQWLRCDAVGSACSAITNGIARTYSRFASGQLRRRPALLRRARGRRSPSSRRRAVRAEPSPAQRARPRTST
jgi:hypothetical protein